MSRAIVASFAAIALCYLLAEFLYAYPLFSVKAEVLADESAGAAIWEAGVAIIAILVVSAVRSKVNSEKKKARLSRTPAAKNMSSVPSEYAESFEDSDNDENSSEKVEDVRDRLLEKQCRGLAVAVFQGNAASLPKLLQTAQAADIKSEDAWQKTTRRINACLRACASHRCFSEALAAYDQVADSMGSGCPSTWSLLLYSAVEAGEFERCSTFIPRILAFGEPTHHDFINMVRYYTKQDAEGFRAVLTQLASCGFKPDAVTRNRALGICSSHNAFKLVEVIIEMTKSVPMDVVGFNTYMRMCAQRNKVSHCLRILEQMKELGLTPSDVTYGTVLDACAKRGVADTARRIFQELRESTVQVNVVHYTAFMTGLLKAGAIDEARGILNEILESDTVEPDMVTYTTLIKAYSEKGSTDEAMTLLEDMKSHGYEPDNVLFNIALSSYCSVEISPEKIFAVLDKLRALGLKPTTATASVLLKILCKNDGYDEAMDLLTTMPFRFGLRPSSRLFEQLVLALTRAGRLRDAESVQEQAAAVAKPVRDQRLKQ